jgi:hypothetical protein
VSEQAEYLSFIICHLSFVICYFGPGSSDR